MGLALLKGKLMPKSEDGFAAASSSTPTISESPLGGVPHQAGLQCLLTDATGVCHGFVTMLLPLQFRFFTQL